MAAQKDGFGMKLGFLLALLIFVSPVYACWQEAGERYGINPELLYAIAKTETGVNPHKLNYNKNGTYDIGLMQINSGWLPALAKFGITSSHLWDSCTNINVGAWILAGNIRQFGMNWNAVGAYNAGCRGASRDQCERLRASYAWRVYRNFRATKKAAS